MLELKMNLIIKSFSAVVLSISALSLFAAPTHLTTHNNTDSESNAFIAGTIPSPYPTTAHSTRQIYWNLVKLACYGHISNGKCPAVVKVATNTSQPLEIGTVQMDLSSGDISPKQLSAHGYILTVNGPGETTLSKE